MRFVNETERRERAGAFMAAVAAVRPVSSEAAPAASGVRELSTASLNVLIKTATEPGRTLLGIYESLDLHAAEGKAAVDDLLARGMVRLHRLVRKGRGGQPQVLEVLPLGLAELAKRGIKAAEKKLKRGGFKHDVYARLLEKWAKADGYRQVWFERTLGQKAFDLVLEDREGGLKGIEICLTGSPSWNASQCLKAAGVEGMAKVIVACEDKALLAGIEKQLRELDELGLYRKKIACRLLSEYLPEAKGSGEENAEA